MPGFVDIAALPEFKELLRTVTRDTRQRESIMTYVSAKLESSVGAPFAGYFDMGYKGYEISLSADEITLMIKTKFDSTPEEEMKAAFPYIYQWIKNERQAYDYDIQLNQYRKTDTSIIAENAQNWINYWNVATVIPGFSNASDIIYVSPYLTNVSDLYNVTTANVLWNYSLSASTGSNPFGKTYYGEYGEPFGLVNTPQLVEDGVFEWFYRNFWTGDIVLRAMMGTIRYMPPNEFGETYGSPNPELEVSFFDYSPVDDFSSQRYHGTKTYTVIDTPDDYPIYFTAPKNGEPNENGYKYACKPNMPLYARLFYVNEELNWYYGGLINKFEAEVEEELITIFQEYLSNMTYEKYQSVELNRGMISPPMSRQDFYGTPDNQKIGAFVKSREFYDIVKDTVYDLSVARIVGNWVQPSTQGYGFVDVFNVRVPFPHGRTVRNDAVLNIDAKVIWFAMWRYFDSYKQEMSEKNPVMHRWLLNHSNLWRRSDGTEKTRYEVTPYDQILALINANPFVPSKDSRQQFFSNGPSNIVNNEYTVLATNVRSSSSSYASYFSDLYEWNPALTAASLIGKDRAVEEMQAITILYDSFWTGLPIYVFTAGQMLRKEVEEDGPDILDHVSRVIDYATGSWNPSKDLLFQTPAYRLTGNNDVERLPSEWSYYPSGLNGDKPEDQFAYADGFLYKEYDATGEIQWIGQGLYQKFGSVIINAEIISIITKAYATISYDEYITPSYIDCIKPYDMIPISRQDWEGGEVEIEALKAKTANGTLQKVHTGKYVKGSGRTANDPIAIDWNAVKQEIYDRVVSLINNNDIGLDGSASGSLISKVRTLIEMAFPSDFGYSVTRVDKLSGNQYSITYQNGEIHVVTATPPENTGGGGTAPSIDSPYFDSTIMGKLTDFGSYSRIVPVRPQVFRSNIPRTQNATTVFKIPIMYYSFIPVDIVYGLESLKDAFVIGFSESQQLANLGSYTYHLHNPSDIIESAAFYQYSKAMRIVSVKQPLDNTFGDTWNGFEPILIHSNDFSVNLENKYVTTQNIRQMWCSIRAIRDLTQEEINYIDNLELVDGAAKSILFDFMIVPIAMINPELYDADSSTSSTPSEIIRTINANPEQGPISG